MPGLRDRVKNRPSLPETNYFVFGADFIEGCARISSQPALPPRYQTWMTGRRLEIEVPNPMVYSIDEEDEGILRPYLPSPGAPLMSVELIAALEQAGVDNLDTYDACIQENRTDREYTKYKSVNIIGLISGVDLQKSEYSNSEMSEKSLINLWFKKLVLDESKIGGNLMFRLAENVSVVLVHNSVMESVKAAKIEGKEYLEFTHPLRFRG